MRNYVAHFTIGIAAGDTDFFFSQGETNITLNQCWEPFLL